MPIDGLDRAPAGDGAGRGSVAEVQHDLVDVGDGRDRGTRPPRATRSGARCRGSRSGARRASPRARRRSRRCRPPAAASGGTRCRRPRRAARRGSAFCAATDALAGSPGCAAARGATARRSCCRTSVGDDGRLEEARTAVHDAVADGDDGMRLQRRPEIPDRVEHDSESGGVIGDRQLALRLLVAPSSPPRCARLDPALADALDEAVWPSIRSVSASISWYLNDDEPELTTRTDATTQPAAWIAVIATVLTMSRTSRSAGEVVDRLVQALQHGPDGDGSGAALHRLVGVVARVEVGEDEHRRAPGDGGVRASSPRRRRHRPPRRTGSGPRRGGRASARARAPWPSRTFSTSAPEPDSPVEYDSIATRGSMPNCSAVPADEIAMSASCSDGRVGDDGAVAVDEHAVGERHEEHARDDRDARPGLDDLEGRPDGVRRRVRGAGDHAVGEAEVHHHACRSRRRR